MINMHKRCKDNRCASGHKLKVAVMITRPGHND